MAAFEHLSGLAHLVKLAFVNVEIDLTGPLLVPTTFRPSARVLRLLGISLRGAADSAGHTLCRHLSAMFHNLRELYIYRCYPKVDIESHLGLFDKLHNRSVHYK